MISILLQSTHVSLRYGHHVGHRLGHISSEIMIENIWIPAAMPVVTDWTLPFNATHISCRYSPGHARRAITNWRSSSSCTGTIVVSPPSSLLDLDLTDIIEMEVDAVMGEENILMKKQRLYIRWNLKILCKQYK